MQMLKQAGRMHLNNTHFVGKAGRFLLPKSNIYEADLLEADTLAAAEQFSQLQHDTGQSYNGLQYIIAPIFGHRSVIVMQIKSSGNKWLQCNTPKDSQD